MEKKKVVAVYAGTFDPVTNGHLDIIERASQIFDTLYVTISINPNKKELFSVEERLKMLQEVTKKFDNVIIDTSTQLTVEYAKSIGAKVLVRGLRATMDFEYELQLAFANQYLDDDIEMAFLMTRASHAFISSSTVKEIAMHHGPIDELAPKCVCQALKEKFSEK